MEGLTARWQRHLLRRPWLTVFLSVLAGYLLTAHYVSGHNADTVGAVWPAYAFTHYGTFRLDGVPGLPAGVQYVHLNGHLEVNRSLGVLLAALPLQALLGWTGARPELLGALTASICTAAAAAFAYRTATQLVGSRLALVGTGVLAFGTAWWTIAGAELWTHSVNVLWLSVGLLLLSRERHWLAGLAFSGAVLTRPHLCLVILAIGVVTTVRRKSPMPLLAYGGPAAAALGATCLWNAWYYGTPRLDAAYAGHIDAAVGGSTQFPPLWENLLGTAVSPWCGVLLFTPVVAPLLIAVARNARSAPAWTLACAGGAALYLLAQFRVSDFGGGGQQYGNRYLIEPLLLALPLALTCYRRWSAEAPWRGPLTVTLAATSVALHAVGALLTPFWIGIAGNWSDWYPYVVVRAAGPTGAVVAAVAAGAVLLVALRAWRPTSAPDKLALTQPATA